MLNYDLYLFCGDGMLGVDALIPDNKILGSIQNNVECLIPKTIIILR